MACYRGRKQQGIVRMNTDRGIVGYKDKQEPGYVTVVNNFIHRSIS